MRCFASKPRRGLPFIFSLLFLGLLSLPGFASAQTVAEPVKARDAPDRAMAAIVTGVDQLVCSATVIGPRHVLTAATCVIDPETDAVLADRQVMPRVDLDDGYIPTARRFIRRVFVPVDGAPFGPSDRFEGKLAIVETAELVEHPPFSAETDEAAFDRRETEGDDGILTIRFYDRATGGQMTTSACAALSIALRALSQKDQQFVQLYYMDGLSAEEVAAAMCVSVKTVYSKKHKIRTRLQATVEA